MLFGTTEVVPSRRQSEYVRSPVRQLELPPAFLGGAGAADTVAIAAGCVIAPAANVALGAVDESPPAVFVGAEFQPPCLTLQQRSGEGFGDCAENHRPYNLCGSQ